MASQDVIIRYSGDSSALDTASKKAQASVDNVTGAVDKTATAQKKASAASKDLSDSIGTVGQSAAKSVGLLSKISPAAGEAAGALNDLADVGEVLSEGLATVGVTGGVAAAAIAALAITLGTVIGVYQAYNEESTIAATIAENVAVAEKDRQPILDALAIKMFELKVATGELSEEEGMLATETEKGAQRQIDALSGVNKKIEELTEATHGYSAAIGDFAANLPLADYNLVAIAVDGLTTSSEELKVQLRAENAEKQKTIDANDQLTQATKNAAVAKMQEKEALEDIAVGEREAAKQKANAEKAATERSAAAKAAAAANLKDAETVYGIIEALKKSEQQSNREAQGKLSDSEVITQAYHDEVAAIEAKRVAAVDATHDYSTLAAVNQAADAATLAAGEAYAAKQVALYQETQAAKVKAGEDAVIAIAATQEKQDAIFKKGHDDAILLIEDEKANRLEALNVVSGVIGNIGSLLSEVASRQGNDLSETQDALDKISGLMDDLSTNTVDAAMLSGDALVEAYKSGEVAAGDLTEAQRGFLEQQLAQEEEALQAKQEAEKAAALQTWQIQKQLSAASAIVSAIEATVKGLATGGPALAALYAGLGAAEVAMIETAKPPSFRGGYFGGPIGGGSGVMPDQQLAWIEPSSEVVMPSQGVQAAGGLDAARGQAAGIPSAIESTTVVRFGHREISRIVSSPSARKGILDASVRPRGRGNRYKKVQ